MKRLHIRSAILAGGLGTLAMTVLMYAAPVMGLPAMDLLGALGSVVPIGLSPHLVGGMINLGIGVSLALAYALAFERLLPGPRWARGAVFSLLPWLFAITLMGPAMAMVHTWASPAEARAIANPCAAGSRPTNPCGAVNPCAAAIPRPANPCAATNPCAAVNPCAAGNPAAAASPWLLRVMSLVAHVVFGSVVGLVYRRRPTPEA